MVGTVGCPNEGFHEVEEVCIGFVSLFKGLSGITPESQTETGSLNCSLVVTGTSSEY